MLQHPPKDTQETGGTKPPWWKRFWTWFAGAAVVYSVLYYWGWFLVHLLERSQQLFWPLTAKDGHITWRVPLLTSLLAAVLTSVPFLIVCRRVRRVGRMIGFHDGEQEGISNGKREGFESGRQAGLEEGKQAGFREGHAGGVEEGLSTGRKQGLDEGFLKGEESARHAPAFQLTAPFVQPSLALHKILSSAGMEQSAANIIAEYANLVNDWSHAITSLDLTRDQSPGAELTLGAATLQKYLEQLRIQRHPSTKRPLLPANYEIYAWCVARVLERLAEMGPAVGGTIRVWTHFKKDLRRWYNIAWGKGDCAHSHPWWEKYKNTVISIKRPYSNEAASHSIQMRRLVTTDIAAAGKYLVYVPDSTEPLTIAKATKQFEYHQGCPIVSPEIKAAFALPGMFRAFPIHVIGECGCSPTGHAGWETLKRNFDMVYHDEVISKNVEFSDQDKGVYCAYTSRIPADYSYDDVFLVDMTDFNEGLFGIAYYASPAGELDGIVILADNEIRNLITSFYNPAWKLACEQ
ncbi:MAG: hypothetical protein ABI972_24335 [Acidobacteriota bacterium]